ncbi:hypothetical protein [Halobacterium noricense]|uniref:hypothetical protein n=1 Tax=Halobacterium noricense TaxID=223182 RepID=UPI001E5E19B9|nr:hypothetical protein [Halobacterium noricense]UHH25248.1 hypothetical protein LT974_14870 [Halobacterium noricense]
MANRGEEEPDWTRTHSVSRRHALALGAAAMGSFAGCSRLSDGPSEPAETTTEQPSLAETLAVDAEFTIDEVTLEIGSAAYPDDSLLGTLRLYAAPNLDRSNRTVIAETAIDQREASAEHTLEPDYDLGYAQHFQFTLESDGADEEPLYSPAETFVPFYNAARDTEMIRQEPPATPEGDWAYTDPFYKTDFWFDSPDESPFNTPEVPEDEYDRDWYDYRNITMTALIRFPTYENITEFPGSEEDTATHSPAFDWAVVNLNLDAWELIEAVRWNSIATQKLESGEYSYGDGDAGLVGGVEDYASASNSSRDLMLDASAQDDPYSAYISLRYGGARWDEVATNPVLMNGSRPFSIRAAEELENAFDNPSFTTLEYQDYHKAIALQVFVGQNPFGFATGSYVSTPEETVNKWYKISTGQGGPSGNCQDGTAMYGGIAVHLLDSTYGIVGMQGSVGYHIMGGLLDLEKSERPYEVWPDHPSPTASDVFTFETDYGTVSPVECTYPDPTIGWKNSGGGDYELLSYLANTSVQSQLLLNGSYEPDVDGELRMSAQDPIIQWELHTTEYAVIDDIENFRAS